MLMREELVERGEARQREDEQVIYLSDIVAALKRRKALIFALVGVTTFIGLLYAVLATPLYTAMVTVRPIEMDDGGALSSLGSQLGGAAALVGIDLGGGGSSRDEYIAILRSRALGERFIEDAGLKPYLFPDQWDADKGAWKAGAPGFLGRLARALSKGLAALSGDEGWRERGNIPTLWDAYKLFDEDVRKVSEDRESGLVTLSFEFRDPKRAADWANAYVAMANAEIRNDVLVEATRALAYLNREAEKATVSSLREAISKVIEGQLKKIMLASARPEYAFKVIDKAVVPEERSYPKRALIAILAFMLGGALGVFVALAWEAYSGSLLRPEA